MRRRLRRGHHPDDRRSSIHDRARHTDTDHQQPANINSLATCYYLARRITEDETRREAIHCLAREIYQIIALVQAEPSAT
jgi:hypothetical protein